MGHSEEATCCCCCCYSRRQSTRKDIRSGGCGKTLAAGARSLRICFHRRRRQRQRQRLAGRRRLRWQCNVVADGRAQQRASEREQQQKQQHSRRREQRASESAASCRRLVCVCDLAARRDAAQPKRTQRRTREEAAQAREKEKTWKPRCHVFGAHSLTQQQQRQQRRRQQLCGSRAKAICRAAGGEECDGMAKWLCCCRARGARSRTARLPGAAHLATGGYLRARPSLRPLVCSGGGSNQLLSRNNRPAKHAARSAVKAARAQEVPLFVCACCAPVVSPVALRLSSGGRCLRKLADVTNIMASILCSCPAQTDRTDGQINGCCSAGG